MRKYINNASVPLSLAVFLATDNYDHDDTTVSVTTLIKPIRQTVLGARVPADDALVDISNLVQSRLGSAVHDGIESAWLNGYKKAMAGLGYPAKVIERVLVNPAPEDLYEGCIPVYLEQRSYKEIGGRRVSGKFDFVGDGQVEDFKNTTVYTWINQTKTNDYILQGSLYRWLNPTIITKDTMAIQFIFSDWQAVRAKTDPNYPPNRTVQKLFKLMPLPETEQYVRNRVALLDRYWNAPEQDIPRCTDDELWRQEPVYKYYKNPNNTGRSTKNFDTKQDAYVRMSQDGNVGKVVEHPGQVVACKYCSAFPVCTQKDDLIAAGDLIL
jgi:hypothetical protein